MCATVASAPALITIVCHTKCCKPHLVHVSSRDQYQSTVVLVRGRPTLWLVVQELVLKVDDGCEAGAQGRDCENTLSVGMHQDVTVALA
jgi:hypothetical protein